MSTFLLVHHTNTAGDPVLINIDNIASIERRYKLSTGEVIGSEISLNASQGYDETNLVTYSVRESFEDIKKYLRPLADYIDVSACSGMGKLGAAAAAEDNANA